MKPTISNLILGVFLLSCSDNSHIRLNPEISLPFYIEPTFTPIWPKQETDEINEHQIADWNFINQDGDTISNETLTDKIYVTNFFFTICPSVCPRMTKNLEIISEKFKSNDQVKILSHSVMPWVDSVEVLSKFAKLNGINSDQWHLVTGEKDKIYHLARNSYFADEGFGKSITSDEDFLHTENILLIDQQRRIRGIYNGTIRIDMLRLIDDINTLL